jgi:hypothetical protein
MSAEKSKGSQNEEGGVHIGGNVTVKKGDFVGRDKHVNDRSVHAGRDINNSQIVTGDENTLSQQNAVREELFQELFKKIEERPDTPSEDKEDLKSAVEEIRAEAAKNESANESFLAQRLRNIKRMAPDILAVVTATLTNPAAGFALVVQKIADKMKTDSDNMAVKA